MTIRARVCDPRGPRWMRLLPVALALGLMLLGLAMPAAATARASTALLGAAILFGAPLLRRRWRPRDAEVRVGYGWVDLRAGALSQRVHAREVTGASTAATARGVALALARGGSGVAPPLVLEVPDDAAADRVRRALGVGPLGLGQLVWPTRLSGWQVVQRVAFGLLAAIWLAMAFYAAVGQDGSCLALAGLLVPLTVVGLPIAIIAREVQPRLVLEPEGLAVLEPGAVRVPYADVTDAAVVGADVVVSTAAGRAPVLVPLPRASPEERAHVAAQIRSASMRARGAAVAVQDLPAPLAVLAPRGEGHRAWLDRLDAAAASMAARGGSPDGYRGAMPRVDDLWSALESPDVVAPVRAGAARVLMRVDPANAGPRIAQILAAERDGGVRVRIRIAAEEEDADDAARKLARLDRRAGRG